MFTIIFLIVIITFYYFYKYLINNSVFIYDNCFDHIKLWDEKFLDVQYIFDRNNTPSNQYERFIHKFLNQINDNSRYIEYWTRLKHQFVGWHKDNNEKLYQESSLSFHPNHGHIAYLDNTKFPAPTSIYNIGTYFLSHVKNGRVTRFKGNLFHAVAPPTIDQDRPVLLFNTWNEPPSNFQNNTKPPTDDIDLNVNTNNLIKINNIQNFDFIPHKLMRNNKTFNFPLSSQNGKIPFFYCLF